MADENAARPTVEGAERQARRREIMQMLAACGDAARVPSALIEHYVETGVLDGTLWPIVVPIVGWPGNE